MDLSKLPKLSESPPPPPVQPDPAPVRPTYSASSRPEPSRAEMGIDIWLSLIIGLVLIFLGINFGSYLKSKLTGQPFATGITWTSGPKANQPVEYFDLQGGTAYGEMGYFLMGAALMVDGAVLLLAMMTGQHRKKLILLAMFCAVLGCLANGFACVMVYQAGIMPIISLLILAIGGAMVMYQSRYLADA